MEFSSGRYRTKSARKKRKQKHTREKTLDAERNAIKLNARWRELLFVYNPLCTLELVISRKNKQSDTDQRQHRPRLIADRLNLLLCQATVDRAQIILTALDRELLCCCYSDNNNNNNSCFHHSDARQLIGEGESDVLHYFAQRMKVLLPFRIIRNRVHRDIYWARYFPPWRAETFTKIQVGVVVACQWSSCIGPARKENHESAYTTIDASGDALAAYKDRYGKKSV